MMLVVLAGLVKAQSADYDFRIQSSTDVSLGYYNIGGFCANLDFKINPDSTTVTLVKVTPLSPDSNYRIGQSLVLPSSVTTGFGEEAQAYTVTIIGEGAFAGPSGAVSQATRFTSLALPPTVVEIRKMALSWLMADSLTICGSVQHICDSVFMPPTTEGFSGPFWGYFNFNGTIRQWLDMDIDGDYSNPLVNSHSLRMYGELVDTLVVPEGDRVLKPNHFAYNMALRSLTLPSTIDSIGEGTFKYCTRLESVDIPYSTRYVGNECFKGCIGLKRVNFNATNCQYAGEFYHGVFAECDSISEINIGEYVQEIPDVTFMYCSGVRHLSLPAGLVRIGTASFAQCTGLEGKIVIPAGLTSLGGHAFDRCENLDTIVFNARNCAMTESSENPPFAHNERVSVLIIGSEVGTIGGKCFAGLTGVSKVESHAVVPPYVANEAALSDIDPGALLKVPCGSEWDYREAYGWSQFGTVRSDWTYVFDIQSEDVAKGTVQIRTQPSCDNLRGEILAHPNPGYAFKQWSDGDLNDHRWVAVTGDVHLTAYFEESEDVEGIDAWESEDVRVYARQQEVVVECESERQVTICDMMGRVVADDLMTGHRQYRMPSVGVYVVKVGPTARKVVVGR